MPYQLPKDKAAMRIVALQIAVFWIMDQSNQWDMTNLRYSPLLNMCYDASTYKKKSKLMFHSILIAYKKDSKTYDCSNTCLYIVIVM